MSSETLNLFSSGVFQIADAATQIIESYSKDGIGLAKMVVEFAEPYQPTLAMTSILGKLSWRLYQYEPLKEDIQKLSRKINFLKGMLKNDLSQKRINEIRRRLETLKVLRLEKKRQLDLAGLTLGQLPNLFFSHPGSNIYNSTHQIVARGLQMHYLANPSTEISKWKQAYTIALGLIAIAGAGASIARQAGMVEEELISQGFIRVALGVSVLETAILAKDAVRSFLK